MYIYCLVAPFVEIMLEFQYIVIDFSVNIYQTCGNISNGDILGDRPQFLPGWTEARAECMCIYLYACVHDCARSTANAFLDSYALRLCVG
jgi:hypothetical protein